MGRIEATPVPGVVYEFLINSRVYKMKYIKSDNNGYYLFETNGYLSRPMAPVRFSYLHNKALLSETVSEPIIEQKTYNKEFYKPIIEEEPEQTNIKAENLKAIKELENLSSEEESEIKKYIRVNKAEFVEELKSKIDNLPPELIKTFNKISAYLAMRRYGIANGG